MLPCLPSTTRQVVTGHLNSIETCDTKLLVFPYRTKTNQCSISMITVCIGGGKLRFWCHVLWRPSGRGVWDSYSRCGACCFLNSLKVSKCQSQIHTSSPYRLAFWKLLCGDRDRLIQSRFSLGINKAVSYLIFIFCNNKFMVMHYACCYYCKQRTY